MCASGKAHNACSKQGCTKGTSSISMSRSVECSMCLQILASCTKRNAWPSLAQRKRPEQRIQVVDFRERPWIVCAGMHHSSRQASLEIGAPKLPQLCHQCLKAKCLHNLSGSNKPCSGKVHMQLPHVQMS